MSAPLEGVRVLELTSFVAAPSAAVILSDLGADVIKVEPPNGDPLRGMMRPPKLAAGSPSIDPGFEVDNRGKRSLAVAIDHADGADLVRRLAAKVQVLITNLLPHRQQRYGLDAERLFAVNPRLVHATLTGYGTTGPEAWRPGYDVTAFFGRGTISDVLTPPEGAPPQPAAGQGDHTAGLALTIAVLAGLRQVERTGQGLAVETSLLSAAVWTMACDIAPTLVDRRPRTPRDRRHALSALANSYPCKDGRWIILTMPQPHWWGRFCEAVGRSDLADDPRYQTVKSRFENMPELVDTLDELFATRTAAEWGDLFDAHGLVWGPVQRLHELVDDPQARAAGYFTAVDHHEAGVFDTVAIPLKVHGADVRPRAAAPGLGQHSWEVLTELGLADAEIEALLAAGVVH